MKKLVIIAAALVAASALHSTGLQDVQAKADAVARRAGADTSAVAVPIPIQAALRSQPSTAALNPVDAVLQRAVDSAILAAAGRGQVTVQAGGALEHARSVLTSLSKNLAGLRGQAAGFQRDAALNRFAAELLDAALSAHAAQRIPSAWSKPGPVRGVQAQGADEAKLEIAGLLLDGAGTVLDLSGAAK